jgi:hypothetical protein
MLFYQYHQLMEECLFSLKWVIKFSLNWIIKFCSDGLHVVALISVLVRSFVLSIRSNVYRRYQHSSYYDVHWWNNIIHFYIDWRFKFWTEDTFVGNIVKWQKFNILFKCRVEDISSEWVSDCCLAPTQQFCNKNKLIFNEMMVKSAFY